MVRDYYGAPAHLKRSAHSSALPNEAQSRCDVIQAEYRASQTATRETGKEEPAQRRSIRREPPPTPPALIPTDNKLFLRIADELEFARRMIEQMGDTLSADPVLIGRHMVSLQTVDIAGQMMGHLANIIRSSDPPAAVDRVGMGDLKARLQRRSVG